MYKQESQGWVWWLMPVIPALWEAEVGRSPRSGVRDLRGQRGETLSLQKIQKLAGCGVVHLWSQLLGRLRQENRLNPGGGSCSETGSCHCTPAWQQSKTSSQNKQKNKENGVNMLCSSVRSHMGSSIHPSSQPDILHPTIHPSIRPSIHPSIHSCIQDRKSTRLNSSHIQKSRMPSSA